jgi:hypothetical protein
MTTYTDHQNATIAALLKGFCPDQSRWDGIKAQISKRLGDGAVTDAEVLSAAHTALVANSGVFVPPFAAAAAAAAQPHRAGPPRHR